MVQVYYTITCTLNKTVLANILTDPQLDLTVSQCGMGHWNMPWDHVDSLTLSS